MNPRAASRLARWTQLAGWVIPAVILAVMGCDKDSPLAPGVSQLEAEIVGDEVFLTWDIKPGTQVRLLRRLDTPPEGPADPLATTLLAGYAFDFSDSLLHLLPSTATTPRTYHYAVYPCASVADCRNEASRASIAPSLVECLRAGGYNFWWRHASATVCADRLDLGTAATTTVPNWWKSCDANCPPAGGATARQLSTVGEDEAIAIGRSFDALEIPVGRVISSEYCRCVHTAELNDFGPTIEQNSGITYFVYDEANRCASSQALIAELPPAGSNTAIIGQAGFSGSCPTLNELAWGEAAIYKPKGDGTAELIARLKWNEWPAAPVAQTGRRNPRSTARAR